MKPVPFFAALVPILATSVLVGALRHGLAWYNAVGLFYGALALAELAYLGGAFARNSPGLPELQDRSAKTGAVE